MIRQVWPPYMEYREERIQLCSNKCVLMHTHPTCVLYIHLVSTPCSVYIGLRAASCLTHRRRRDNRLSPLALYVCGRVYVTVRCPSAGPSVCPSVCSISNQIEFYLLKTHLNAASDKSSWWAGPTRMKRALTVSDPLQAAAVGLLLWARQAGRDIDRWRWRRSSGKCGQCHVVSWRRKLSTDLLNQMYNCCSDSKLAVDVRARYDALLTIVLVFSCI